MPEEAFSPFPVQDNLQAAGVAHQQDPVSDIRDIRPGRDGDDPEKGATLRALRDPPGLHLSPEGFLDQGVDAHGHSLEFVLLFAPQPMGLPAPTPQFPVRTRRSTIAMTKASVTRPGLCRIKR
jgi:hypothetical protein